MLKSTPRVSSYAINVKYVCGKGLHLDLQREILLRLSIGHHRTVWQCYPVEQSTVKEAKCSAMNIIIIVQHFKAVLVNIYFTAWSRRKPTGNTSSRQTPTPRNHS